MRRTGPLTAIGLALLLAAGAAPAAWSQAGPPEMHHPPEAGPPAMPPGPPPGAAPGPPAGAAGCDMPMRPPGMGMMREMMQGMAGHGAGGMMHMEGPTDPVAAAFDAINRRMHRDMAVEPSGSADKDFARAMIAHHQGAIDMAKVELGFGKDPEMRKLAEQVIAAQEQEIATLRQWLARQPQ